MTRTTKTTVSDIRTGQTIAAGAAVQAPPPVVVLKRKEFVARVMAETGFSKSEAQTATDAALNVLARALSAGEEISIPNLGKLKVNRRTAQENAEVIVVKLRRKTAAGGEAEGGDKAPRGRR